MNKKIKKQWVAALRSGEYRQGSGRLRDNGEITRFCCLGVLCDLHSKATKHKWRGEHYYDKCGLLPNKVIQWAGLKETTPGNDIPILFKTKKTTLSLVNDDKGARFNTIAKLIEEQL